MYVDKSSNECKISLEFANASNSISSQAKNKKLNHMKNGLADKTTSSEMIQEE